MSWDEHLFGALYSGAKTWLGRGARPDPAAVAHLEDHRERLTHLAQLLAGVPLELRAAEADGGWAGDAIYLPIDVHAFPLRADNEALLQARIPLAITSRRLGFTLPAGLDTPWERGLATVLALPATLAALGDEYPAARERVLRLAASLRPQVPAKAAVDQALEALLGAALGEEAPPWDFQPPADAEALDGAVKEAKRELAKLGRPRQPRLRTAILGTLMPAAPRTLSQGPGPGPSGSPGAALPSGTERRGKPKERVETLSLDQRPEAENPLVHSFEKVHTLEAYKGGQKRIDGEDELGAHQAALDELDLRQVIRSNQTSKSIYRMDAMFEGSAPDLNTETEGPGVLYDEWDPGARSYKREWCKVRPFTLESTSSEACHHWAQGVRRQHRRVIDDVRQEILRHDRARALRDRQEDGPELDLRAVVDRQAALRAGNDAEDRLYRARRRHPRDVAALLLIDASLSTDGWIANRRILDVAKESVLVLGAAMEGITEDVGIAAFSSHTRRDCRFAIVKGFDEAWSVVAPRIHGLEPDGYTRIGPALRHATVRLADSSARRKLLIVLSDGKPTDYDRYEGRYGLGDVAQAIREARAQHIYTYALAIAGHAEPTLPGMFGPGHYAVVPDPGKLSVALPKLLARGLG